MVDIIFEFINFFLTFALMIYGFKRFGLLFLQKGIAEQQEQHAQLIIGMQKLELSQQELNAMTKEQMENYEKLKKNFAQWKNVEKVLEEQSAKNQKELLEKSRQRSQAAQELYFHALQIDAVAKESVKNAEIILREKMMNEHSKRVFMNRVITSLQEQAHGHANVS